MSIKSPALQAALAMAILARGVSRASPFSEPATDPVPLPPVIAAAVAELHKYTTQGKLPPDRSLTVRDVVFLRDERDLLVLVDTLIEAYGRSGPSKLKRENHRAVLLDEFRSRGAFTVANRFPVFYNGASDRWQRMAALAAEGKADRVKYVIAADLVHEVIHARGIRDEVIACRAQLELLHVFFREGRYYLAEEIKSVQQQCKTYERSGRFGKRLP